MKKRQHQTQACERCQTLRVKCERSPVDSSTGELSCTSCQQIGTTCTFAPQKRRGPKKASEKEAAAAAATSTHSLTTSANPLTTVETMPKVQPVAPLLPAMRPIRPSFGGHMGANAYGMAYGNPIGMVHGNEAGGAYDNNLYETTDPNVNLNGGVNEEMRMAPVLPSQGAQQPLKAKSKAKDKVEKKSMPQAAQGHGKTSANACAPVPYSHQQMHRTHLSEMRLNLLTRNTYLDIYFGLLNPVFTLVDVSPQGCMLHKSYPPLGAELTPDQYQMVTSLLMITADALGHHKIRDRCEIAMRSQVAVNVDCFTPIAMKGFLLLSLYNWGQDNTLANHYSNLAILIAHGIEQEGLVFPLGIGDNPQVRILCGISHSLSVCGNDPQKIAEMIELFRAYRRDAGQAFFNESTFLKEPGFEELNMLTLYCMCQVELLAAGCPPQLLAFNDQPLSFSPSMVTVRVREETREFLLRCLRALDRYLLQGPKSTAVTCNLTRTRFLHLQLLLNWAPPLTGGSLNLAAQIADEIVLLGETSTSVLFYAPMTLLAVYFAVACFHHHQGDTRGLTAVHALVGQVSHRRATAKRAEATIEQMLAGLSLGVHEDDGRPEQDSLLESIYAEIGQAAEDAGSGIFQVGSPFSSHSSSTSSSSSSPQGVLDLHHAESPGAFLTELEGPIDWHLGLLSRAEQLPHVGGEYSSLGS